MIERIEEDTFQSEVLDADCVVLVNFWVGWSDECRKMRLLMEALDRLPGPNVRIVEIDWEKARALRNELEVYGVPTLLIFKSGDATKRLSGTLTPDEIRDELRSVVAPPHVGRELS